MRLLIIKLLRFLNDIMLDSAGLFIGKEFFEGWHPFTSGQNALHDQLWPKLVIRYGSGGQVGEQHLRGVRGRVLHLLHLPDRVGL